MHKDFYEFLFNLRASGFVHNTPEGVQHLRFAALKSAEPLKWIGVQGDGEPGSLSDDALTNMRNMVIGLNFVMCQHAVEANVDYEYTQSVSDYFINKVERMHSPAQIESLLREMARSYAEVFEKRSVKSYGRQIDRCIHYIQQNLYSQLTAAAVAEYAGLTAAYLTTIFRQATGKSLYRYIQDLKIDEAKDMLAHTDQPLTAIAAALGYNSISHFSKAFRASVGVSPLKWRNTHE